MNEECLNAQTAISATYDGEHVDAAAIAAARTHSAECADCAEFVRTLAAVRRVPAPAADPAALDSAIAAMRAEAERAAEERAVLEAMAAAETQPEAAAQPQQVPSAPTAVETPVEAAVEEHPAKTADSVSELLVRLSGAGRQRWAVWGAWAAGAAAVLFIAGIATLQGARFIASQTRAGEPTAIVTGTAVDTAGETNAPAEESQDGAVTSLGTAPGTAATGARYITLGDWVYEYTSDITVNPANAQKVGNTTSALDTKSAPASYDVFFYGTKDHVTIESGGRWMDFVLVTRSFQGKRYGLQSPPLSGFEQWPTLPAGITTPTGTDGSPDLERYLPDDQGVTIFRIKGREPQAGFAIAPGTSTSDPARGNPNWTWWAPLP